MLSGATAISALVKSDSGAPVRTAGRVREGRNSMSYREQDIKHETADFWVLDVGARGFEVYRTGPTHSTRCAQIGYRGELGLAKAIAECDRRQSALTA